MRRILASLAFAATGAAGFLAASRLGRRRARGPARQADLDRAVAAVDRELAANLELTTMFDQTKQAFVLENGQFLVHRLTLEREIPEAFGAIADLYERIPAAESAMERRGPAGSIAEADRLTVEEWEGDARSAQISMRSAALEPERSLFAQLVARLRKRVSP